MSNFNKVFLFLFVCFFALWLVINRNEQVLPSNISDIVAPSASNDSNRDNPDSSLIYGNYYTGPKNIKKDNKANEDVVPLEVPLVKRSKKYQREFLKAAKLDAKFPGGFEYLYFDDIAKDTILIEGLSNEQGVYMATVATKKRLQLNEVLPTLKQNPDMLPSLNDSFAWLNTNTEPVKLNNLQPGISEAHYWVASNNGKKVAVVYGERADQSGSYFFLVHGPQDYVDGNEGMFEKYLESLKPKK